MDIRLQRNQAVTDVSDASKSHSLLALTRCVFFWQWDAHMRLLAHVRIQAGDGDAHVDEGQTDIAHGGHGASTQFAVVVRRIPNLSNHWTRSIWLPWAVYQSQFQLTRLQHLGERLQALVTRLAGALVQQQLGHRLVEQAAVRIHGGHSHSFHFLHRSKSVLFDLFKSKKKTKRNLFST